MTKRTLLSLAAATLLFTACGEDAKNALSDVAASATEKVKETTSSAIDSAKQVASNALEASKAKAANVADAARVEAERLASTAAEEAAKAKEVAAKKAAEAAAALKERAASVTETASETTDKAAEVVSSAKETVSTENAAGKAVFAKCAGCHGSTGKTKALGKSEVIAGQPAADLEDKLKAYQAGTRNVAGMGMLMKGQVASMDEAGIKAVSEYISGL